MDEAQTAVLDTSAYCIAEGWTTLPELPGWGSGLDTQRLSTRLRLQDFAA